MGHDACSDHTDLHAPSCSPVRHGPGQPSLGVHPHERGHALMDDLGARPLGLQTVKHVASMLLIHRPAELALVFPVPSQRICSPSTAANPPPSTVWTWPSSASARNE